MERVVSELMELLGYLLVGGAFLVNLVLAFFVVMVETQQAKMRGYTFGSEKM